MRRVPDRKKQRSDYVRKKAEAYTSGALCWLLLFVTLSITIVCAGVAAFIFVKLLWRGDLAEEMRSHVEEALAGAVISAPLAGFCSWHLWKGIKDANDRAQLPYVPPVTASTLPADAVLVRGAAEPTAPNETLLRATMQGDQSKPEELLRSHLP